MSGMVYLVGAGPGDPELLTRKAYRLLLTAGVVLHDELVSPQILALIPRTTHVINVGKRCGEKRMSQERINAMIVAGASGGATVVRLKGGDPLVFGRAGEEMDALRSARIPFEVVPGITAALGAAAVAQIPLTDRRSSSRVTFLTGHHCPGHPSADDRAALPESETLVLYMPGHDYPAIASALLSRGWTENTPCVLVSRATLSEQQILRTTLAELPHASGVAAPAILILGTVAAPLGAESAPSIPALRAPQVCAIISAAFNPAARPPHQETTDAPSRSSL